MEKKDYVALCYCFGGMLLFCVSIIYSLEFFTLLLMLITDAVPTLSYNLPGLTTKQSGWGTFSTVIFITSILKTVVPLAFGMRFFNKGKCSLLRKDNSVISSDI